MTRVLITGKSGYVSNKVKEWLEADTTYAAELSSIKDVDLSSMDFSAFDVIFHPAGIVPNGSQSDDFVYKVNRDMTFQLAQKAKADGVKQFIFLSTMAVYGINPGVRNGKGIVTSTTECSPNSCYGKSKYEAEILLNSLHDDNFKITIIRAPSIYGPDNLAYFQQYVYLLGRLFIQPLAFTNCKRSAIYIDNLSELIRLVIENSYAGIICPQDKDPLATVEFVKFLSAASGKRTLFSRMLGTLLKLFFSRSLIVNQIWGSVAYTIELSQVFDGKYQLHTVKDALKLALYDMNQVLSIGDSNVEY